MRKNTGEYHDEEDESMRKVVLEKPGVLHIIESDPPVAKPGQSLVELHMAGICGSDLAAYRGVSPLAHYPCVPGHELVVRVVDCPERPELRGRRCVVEPLVPCGVCRACRHGRYNCCTDLRVMGVHVDGGMQEIVAIGSRQLYPVPDTMSDEVAVLAEPASIAYRAVQRSAIEAGQVAVVLGAGPIGLLISHLLLRARGCRVLAVDIDPGRLEKAAGIGAVPAGGDPQEVVSAVRRATGGDMADVVFEATGSPDCTKMTTELVAHAGRIVLIGWNKGPVQVDTVTLMRKEADLLGSRNSNNAFPAVLRLLEDGVIDPADIISHRFDLEGTPSALAMLDSGKEPALKVIVKR